MNDTMTATPSEIEEFRTASAQTPGVPPVEDASVTASPPSAPLELDEMYERIRRQPRDRWLSLINEYAGDDHQVARQLFLALPDPEATVGPDEDVAAVDEQPDDGVRQRKAGQGRGVEALQAHTRVGDRYWLNEKIGGGASGDVWKAYDRELDRWVALKIFDVTNASDRAAIAMIREAQASSRIVSEFVIRVYDTLIDERRGVGAIVMELCEENGERGKTLDNFVGDGVHTTSDAGRVALWVYQIALGADEGHQLGVFHRDLKPENVVVRQRSRRAQLLDFGLAAHNVSNLSPKPGPYSLVGRTLTMNLMGDDGKAISGTPGYMATLAGVGLCRRT